MYAQQNGVTSICAHVALRSVLSLLLPEGDISYGEINRFAGREPTDVNGLAVEQIRKVISQCYVKSRCNDKNPIQTGGKQDRDSFSPLLYGYVESGCPALLSFGVKKAGIGHIVPVLGHTFNESTWVAEARNGYFDDCDYYSSEGWLGTYLIHDDNFGPYQSIPRGFIKQNQFWNLFGLHYAGAALWSDRAELDALEIFKRYVAKHRHVSIEDSCFWFDCFSSFCKEQQLVLRSVFIQRSEYIDFLHRWQLEDSAVNRLDQSLPETFWMIEVSCPELFPATRGKFGEMLLTYENANENSGGTTKLLALRLPGVVAFADGTAVRTKIKSYTPLFSK